jgi:hypothetical protein
MLLDACIWCTFNQPVHSLWISAPQSCVLANKLQLEHTHSCS